MLDLHDMESNASLSGVDPNFAPARVGDREVVWHDATRPPAALEGLPFRAGPDAPLWRLPGPAAKPHVAAAGAEWLMHHTAGACVRFQTDSPFVAVRARLADSADMNHMPRAGSAGFDLYRGSGPESRHAGTAQPDRDEEDLVRMLCVRNPGDAGMESWQLNLPLYGGAAFVQVGLAPGAVLRPPAPHRLGRICFYGSSITQGGCASRPGNAYTTMVCRALDAEQVNLGFSGSARGEPAMAELIASIRGLAAFVMDYDYNAPTPEHLAATHEPFFRIVRAARPDLPILVLSAPSVWNDSPDTVAARRRIVRTTVRRARAAGDRNVHFLDGARLFGRANRDDCTVDRVHPNDLGFRRMADAVLSTAFAAKLRELFCSAESAKGAEP